MKQALVRLPNERPECNDIKLGDCLYLFRTHRGRSIAPKLKIFKWKFTTPPGIEPRTRWTRGRHATIWASVASFVSYSRIIKNPFINDHNMAESVGLDTREDNCKREILSWIGRPTVYEKQLETKFWRETENVFTLSLSRTAAIMVLMALVLPPPSFLWKRQWWLVPLCSDH